MPIAFTTQIEVTHKKRIKKKIEVDYMQFLLDIRPTLIFLNNLIVGVRVIELWLSRLAIPEDVF